MAGIRFLESGSWVKSDKNFWCGMIHFCLICISFSLGFAALLVGLIHTEGNTCAGLPDRTTVLHTTTTDESTGSDLRSSHPTTTTTTIVLNDPGSLISNIGTRWWLLGHGVASMVIYPFAAFVWWSIAKQGLKHCGSTVALVLLVCMVLFRLSWISVGASLLWVNCKGDVKSTSGDKNEFATCFWMVVIVGLVEIPQYIYISILHAQPQKGEEGEKEKVERPTLVPPTLPLFADAERRKQLQSPAPPSGLPYPADTWRAPSIAASEGGGLSPAQGMTTITINTISTITISNTSGGPSGVFQSHAPTGRVVEQQHFSGQPMWTTAQAHPQPAAQSYSYRNAPTQCYGERFQSKYKEEL